MKKRVLLLSPTPSLLDCARQQSLEAVCVFTSQEFRRLPDEAPSDEICLVSDELEQPQRLLDATAALHAHGPFTAVVAFREERLKTAALINDQLGLNGVASATVGLLRDKWRMRRHLKESRCAVVAAGVGSTLVDIRSFGALHGYPLIAKPLGGTGSIGIFKIDDAAEAESVYERLFSLGLQQFLLEEFLEGREVSVDSISFDGRHVPVAIVDKITGRGFVEFGHTTPAILDESVESAVCRTVADFLDVVGLRDGLSHTEVKLTPQGPRIVEGHNRRGGDRMNLMTSTAYGVDLEEAALTWAVGDMEPLVERPGLRCAVSIAYMEAEPGRVLAIEGTEDLGNHPAVVDVELSYDIGQLIPPVRCSMDRVGSVMVKAETPQEARKLAQTLASRVRFVTKADPRDEAQELQQRRNLMTRFDQDAGQGEPVHS